MPIDSLGILKMTFNINFTGAAGYRIKRNNNTIIEQPDTNYGNNYEVVFYDKTGKPNVQYNYTVELYTNRPDMNGNLIPFSSDQAGDIHIFTQTYPLPPSPKDFYATDGTYPNKIALTWKYDMQIPVDNFIIDRKLPNDVMATISRCSVRAPNL